MPPERPTGDPADDPAAGPVPDRPLRFQHLLILAQQVALAILSAALVPSAARRNDASRRLFEFMEAWTALAADHPTWPRQALDSFDDLDERVYLVNTLARPVCEGLLRGEVPEPRDLAELVRFVSRDLAGAITDLVEVLRLHDSLAGTPAPPAVAPAIAGLSDAAPPGDGDDAAEQLTWDLLQGLRSDSFEPYFQPQVEARSGKVVGFESLARWTHPTRGLLVPFHFLAAARRAGILTRIDVRLIEKTFAHMRDWLDRGLKVPKVSINMTADRLVDGDIVDSLAEAATAAGLAPGHIGIEILESVMIDAESHLILRNANRLSDAGFGLELDDFGTGHAAMSNLRHLNIDRIKIDKSFVRDIHLHGNLAKITASMINLAHSLRIDALAEGVEKPEERMVLNALGCDFIQGFGVARPMPAAAVPAWLGQSQRGRKLPPRAARHAAAG